MLHLQLNRVGNAVALFGDNEVRSVFECRFME
jgi:hypothetical protein